MKKSLFLLVPAAFGMLTLSACFDESSTSGSSESNKSACLLNPSETGLEITCNNESYGFLKTSSAGVYGSCGAEALRDDSGFKLVCGGDSVGVVYNGKAGRNGVNGDNGLNGQNGENGTSCEAKKVESGFELFCGEKKVGLIPNGHSCTVSKTDGASVISCEDGTEATVLNGINGKNGTNGINGTSCTTSSLKSSDLNGTYATITCGTTTVKIYDGAEGEQGEQGEPGENCTVSKNATTGVTTITCGDDVAKVYDGENGAAGKNGDNCSIEDNGDGTATITCGTGAGASTYIVKDGAAGANGDNCTIEDNENGTATITCGTATYTVNDGAAGAKGDAGYGCSSTAGEGYVDVKCQTGIDEDEKPVYTTNRILAAGFATCGEEDEVYNTLTHACVAGEKVPLSSLCGGAVLADGHLCYNNEQKDTNDYALCGTSLYEKATQFCSAYNTVVEKCGTKVYDVATQYCKITGTEEDPVYTVTNIYGVCGTALYDSRTHFCNAGAIYALCGLETYDPDAEYCSSTSVVTALSACTVDETTIPYNPETHDCDESGVEPVVTPKE